MSDHVVLSYNDIDGIAGQSRRHHKTNWMAHWMDRSCKTAARDSLNYESKEDDHRTRQWSLLGGSEIETNISVFSKGSREVSTVRTAKILDKSPVTSSQNLKTEGYDWKQASPFQQALPEAEIPSRDYNFQPPKETVKYHNFFEKKSLVASTTSMDDFIGSTSRAVPCQVKSNAPILSMSIGEQTNPSSSLMASKEQYANTNFDSYSTFIIRENRTGYMMNSRRPGASSSGHLLHDPSTSNDQLPVGVGKLCNNPIGIGAFSCECCHQMPNLSAGGQMFRESTVSAKFKGKMLSKLYSLPQDIGFSGRQGVRIQLLESSTDSGERESVGPVKTSTVGLKNESSADTDTMEMNALQKNHISAYSPSPSNKDIKVYQVSSPSLARGDTGLELWNTELRDKRQKLPALSAAPSSTDDKDTSSSRTQSLDVERLFSTTEQAADSKSNPWPSDDPSIRWVKRLKLNTASDSPARGTQSSKMGDASSHEKANKLFSKARSRCHGKEKTVQDQTLSHNWIKRWCHNQASGPQKNKEAVVKCAPESFKETSNQFQKKQFPSIAAMALMGKAMNGLRPCEFRKMGSSVVWNTKGY